MNEKTASGIQWPEIVNGIMVFSRIEDQITRVPEMNETLDPALRRAVFTVFAEPYPPDSSPLEFQWFKNGKAIMKAATGPTYTIEEVKVSDVGFYTCEVKGKMGSVNVGSVELDSPGGRLFVLKGANTIVSGPVQAGSNTKSCIGQYHGKVAFKNATNSIWWSVPAGKTSVTITDTTRGNYTPNYTPRVEIVENTTLVNWCNQNSITAPVVAGRKYQFTTYVTNQLPPPPSQDMLGLDIVWNP